MARKVTLGVFAALFGIALTITACMFIANGLTPIVERMCLVDTLAGLIGYATMETW